jgi:hypothetical protein
VDNSQFAVLRSSGDDEDVRDGRLLHHRNNCKMEITHVMSMALMHITGRLHRISSISDHCGLARDRTPQKRLVGPRCENCPHGEYNVCSDCSSLTVMQFWYLCELLYVLASCLLKIAIAYFYLRVATQ